MKSRISLQKTLTKAIVCLVFLMAIPTVYVLAGNPSGPGGDAGGAPIDGGISLLVAAGIGYGAKKLRDARKGKADDSK